jgi:hypothetical protein
MRTVRKSYLGQSLGLAVVLVLSSIGIILLMTLAVGR